MFPSITKSSAWSKPGFSRRCKRKPIPQASKITSLSGRSFPPDRVARERAWSAPQLTPGPPFLYQLEGNSEQALQPIADRTSPDRDAGLFVQAYHPVDFARASIQRCPSGQGSSLAKQLKNAEDISVCMPATRLGSLRHCFFISNTPTQPASGLNATKGDQGSRDPESLPLCI